MTKRFTILALVAATLTFGGCQSKREKENTTDRSQEVIDSLQRVLAQSNSESEDLAKTIQQIREGFSQTSKETKSAYEAMVEEFNRQLESKSREIEELRKQLAEKDIKIAEQSEQIDQLSDNVEDLTTKNEEKERTVVRQDQQLHTAWYVFGTKKELREQHILERGDVMRSSNFNKEYFTKIDIRVTQKIPLYSKKATLLTSHPAGSYTLDKDAQENYTLRITNPDAFWSVSRYLVILVR